MDERQRDAERHAGEHAEPGAAGDLRHGSRSEGGAQHLAFQRDVDHARALAEQTRHRGEHQRHGQSDGAVQHQQELEGDLAQHQAGTAWGRRANRASSCGRNMFSSAPANRMTRPWITTTRSLLIRGMSKASSVPPW